LLINCSEKSFKTFKCF